MTVDEDAGPLGTSYGRDPRKPRAKPGRTQAPPSLSSTQGRRRSSGGSGRNNDDLDSSQRFAPSLKDIDDPDSPHGDTVGLNRKASLHSRSLSPNASPRSFRRGSGNTHVGQPVGLGANPPPSSNVAVENSNVRVMVRVRPFSQKEVDDVQAEGSYMQSVIDMPRKDQVLLLDHNKDYSIHQGFNFDEVFWSCTQQKMNVEFADQRKVYVATGLPALKAAWDGINTCIFAYGQTGSGKTHTMMGDPSQIANPEGCEESMLGVIPRLCRDLFNELAEKSETAAHAGLRRTADVRVRFYEIYNEKVKDLLGKVCYGDEQRFTYAGTTSIAKLNPEDLKIREHPTEGPYVEGISIHNPRSYEDIIALINAGNQERSVGTTKMNDRSSRSHAIFRITVTQTTFYDQQRVGIGGPKTTTHQRRANINLVDLAGSENVKRSGASGSVLVEAQKINLSLTTLRRVIDALIEKKAKVNVPYRDSTLTWLLREDLGGNSKTFMMATVSPHYLNSHESLRTLEYAMRARSIVNTVRVNEDETAKMIADLEKKILESAQAMKMVASEGERKELEQQMQEAQKARSEIETRLEEAANEALEYKEKLEAEKEKNMAFAFRHAVMLRAARQRLQKAETEKKGESEELATIKKKMRETGHTSVDDMTETIQKERGRVNDLLQEKLAVQSQRDFLESEHRTLKERLHREEAVAQKEKAAADEASKDLARKDVQYKTQLNVVRQRLREEYEALVESHKQQIQRMEESHDKELRAILDENQSMAEEFQTKIDSLQLEIKTMKEEHSKKVRMLEQEAEQQQRYLHADIQRREEMIDKLDAELTLTTKQRAELSKKLEAAGIETLRQRTEALQKQDLDNKEKLTMMKSAHEDRCESLKNIALAAHQEAEERTKEKAEIQRFFADVAKREEKYNKGFDLVCHFLDELPDGELPDSWTLDKVKVMIKSFQKFKREYASFRPNREMLKQLLRSNPSRRGADRIRELLEGTEDAAGEGEGGKKKAEIKVLMGGMKVPEIAGEPLRGGEPGANGAHGEGEELTSAAEKVPYIADAPPAAPAQMVKPVKQRRSRSTPRTSSATPGSHAGEASHFPAENPSLNSSKKRTPRTGRPKSGSKIDLNSSTKKAATARSSTAKPVTSS